jgi:predicted acetyltransferase
MRTEEVIALEVPRLELLESYAAALRRGWSPNNLRDVSAEPLAAIEADPEQFLRDHARQTGTIKLDDGTEVPKLPSKIRWMWDGEFCGSIGLRWQPGTDDLPEYVLGHIGFAVVPWKRGRGYATQALRVMLPEARGVGLGRLEITCDPDNAASRRVIETNGGRLVGEFTPARFGNTPKLRYVIDLD